MNENYNTLEFYNKNAELYFEQTIEANLGEVYDMFLKDIPNGSYILDFGCGSGRDSKYFIEKGYKVKAIDGSKNMCKLASNYIGQDVQCMKFEELDDENIYDAIWACSSVEHVERELLPEILSKMIRAVKKDGTIFISLKKGDGYEIKEGKYYIFVAREEIENIISNIDKNVKIVDYLETIPSTKRKSNTIWSNYILKKF